MAKGAIKEFPFELSLIKIYSPVVNAGVSFMTPLQKFPFAMKKRTSTIKR